MTRLLGNALGRSSLGLIALLCVGFVIAPLTFSGGVWLGMMPFIGILGVAAIGQHIVIQQRGFDLSVGGIMSVSAVLISSQLDTDAAPGFVILAMLGVLLFGAFIGTLNGIIVSYVNVPPLVTTIGMNTIMMAIALQLSGGVPSASPQTLVNMTSARVIGLPLPFIIMLIITVIAVFLMNRTAIGRRFVAVGVSPAAANAIAVSTRRYKLGTYAAAGTLFAAAGLMLAGVLSSPAVHSGTSYMLATLAAVVIGSNPLNGDRGSVLATIFGAVFLTYLNQLVLILGFNYAVQNIVQATIVLAGVAIPTLLSRRASAPASDMPIQATAAATDVSASILHLGGLSKFFGPVQALANVNLGVRMGEIHAIVGENGAGKSTLINLIAGVHTPSTGQVHLDGQDVTGRNTAQMRKLGVSVAYQHPALPPHLTVQECLQLVAPGFDGSDGKLRAAALLDRVASDALRMRPDQLIENLNIAQRHVVEIARALASNPKVLILDEPTEPFQESDVEKLFALLRAERDKGVAIIYISHRLHEVEAVADRISVLRDGEMIETRKATDFTRTEIIDAIVGRALDRIFPPKPDLGTEANPVLTVEGLSGVRYSDVSFDVKPGEIVGLAGVEGQGQRNALRALAGLDTVQSGTVVINGGVVHHISTAAMRKSGVRFVPDDRHLEGIFGSLTIRENVAVGQLDQLAPGGVLSGKKEAELAESVRADLSVRSPNIEAPLSTLSGGNQQKVLFGREIASLPRVLIVDEPTKGVDIGSRSDIYHQLRRLADAGVAVIVGSSDGIELEGLCDRVLIFARGQVVHELSGSHVTDAEITAANLQSTASRQTAKTGASTTGPGWFGPSMGAALILGLIIAALMITVYASNPKFLSPGSIRIMAVFGGALALVSAAQLLCVVIGEIDLSIGPLAGLVVVLASFLLPEEAGGVLLGLGVVGLLLMCAGIGLLQGIAIFWLNLPAMVVTLATFFGFQGISLYLRPTPSGYISEIPGDFLSSPMVGIPLIMVLVIALCVALDLLLGKSAVGRAVRATGSDPASAFRLGVRREHLGPVVFAAAGLLTGLGGLVLASEVGIGSATTGSNYTIMSITAVVLGGTLIGGGRGSVIAVLLGAMLVQVMASSSSFLRLGAEWQNWQVGLATLIAASLFSLLRKAR